MDTIAGRYLVEEQLGKGGFGAVYRCRDTQLDRLVAVKCLHASWCGGEAEARFRREAALAARVEHPHVVRVFEQGVDERGVPFIVSALVEGDTLEARIQAGQVPRDEAGLLDWLRQLAEGLGAVHAAGVLHRDLKPANVFVTEAGLLLGDFGLSRGDDGQTALTRTGQVVGTARYMAPEIFTVGRQDQAADLWALGAILYEVAYGEAFHAGLGVEGIVLYAHEARSLGPQDRGLGRYPALDAHLRVLLEPDPDRRIGSVAELLAFAPPPPPVPGAKGGRPAVGVVAALLGAVALGFGLGPAATPPAPPEAAPPSPAASTAPVPPAEPRPRAPPTTAELIERVALLQQALPVGLAADAQPPFDAASLARVRGQYLEPGTVEQLRRWIDAVVRAAPLEGPSEEWLHAAAAHMGRVAQEVQRIDDTFVRIRLSDGFRALEDSEGRMAWAVQKKELDDLVHRVVAEVPPKTLVTAPPAFLAFLLEATYLDPTDETAALVEVAVARLAETDGTAAVALSEGIQRVLRLDPGYEVLPWTWREEILREHAQAVAATRWKPGRRVRLLRDQLLMVCERLSLETGEPPAEFLALFDEALPKLGKLVLNQRLRRTVLVGLRTARGILRRTPGQREGRAPAYLARLEALEATLAEARRAPDSGR